MRPRMKLWQKIFLVTLTLVMVAISLTSILLIRNSHKLLVEREKNDAVYEHRYLIAFMQNNVAYEQLRQNKLQLPQDELLEIFQKSPSSQISIGFSVYQNGNRIYAVDVGSAQAETALLRKAFSSGRVYTETVDQDRKTVLLVASVAMIQSQKYTIISTYDVTSIYQLFQKQIDRVKWSNVFCAVVIAAILLIFVHILLFPLQKVNEGMRRIAQGTYDEKVTVKSGDELAELAGNMNTMADAIQVNVAALERVAENRKRFIDNLTHEMKTPLTSILGYADLLRIRENVSQEEQQEYAGIIVEEAKRLRSLSGKLMELITLGNTQMDHLETVQLPDLFQEMEKTLQPVFESKNLTLSCRAENIAVCVDTELFKSMLYNLIDNAMKASDEGRVIELSAEWENGHKTITVQDYGTGIPESEISRITEPFYMVDKTRTRKAGGAGLGLSLCDKIAKLHHAELKIESEQGKGTTVKIIFQEDTQDEKT